MVVILIVVMEKQIVLSKDVVRFHDLKNLVISQSDLRLKPFDIGMGGPTAFTVLEWDNTV